jgi:hypothetical protein
MFLVSEGSFAPETTRSSPGGDAVDATRQSAHAGVNMWRAREAVADELYPAWLPLGAVLEAVDTDLPARATFRLQFHRWDLRVDLRPRGSGWAHADDVVFDVAIRRAKGVGSLLSRWKPIGQWVLASSADGASIGGVLREVQAAVRRHPEVEMLLARIAADR